MEDEWLALYISIVKNLSVEKSFNLLRRTQKSENRKLYEKNRKLLKIKNK